MSENPTGPGGNGPAHTADPVQEPSGVEDLPDGTGQEAAKAAQPNVASSLLNAVLEGNSAVVTFLAIVTAIVIGGLLIAFSSPTVLHAWSHLFSAPGAAFSQAWDVAASAFSAMFEGAIFNPHTIAAAFHGGSIAAIFNPLSETAVNATPLILSGLAVALAFRAGLFNIGATGQFIGGAFIAGWIGFAVHMPMILHVVVAVIGGFVGGSITGGFVGYMKARTGAHEVIVTIMLNYVMEFLLLFLLGLAVFRAPGLPNPVSPPVHVAPSRRRELADQCRIPRCPCSRGRRDVAAQPDDGGFRASHGRGQSECRPRGGDEPGADLGGRDADLRRPRGPGRGERDPGD